MDNSLSFFSNGLCTSVYYKPSDLHSLLLYLSLHPSHAKNFIPFSQFLRIRHLGSDDSDFSTNQRQCASFIDRRGYPVSVVQAGYHNAQLIDPRQHYEHHTRKLPTAFHSLSHFTPTTTQLNPYDFS